MNSSSVALVLIVSALAVGCGDDSPTTPTPRAVTTERVVDVTVPARSMACVTFRQEALGPAYAGVFGGQPIEVGSGTCANPGPVIARSPTIELSLMLPVGDHYARFEHRGNFEFTFSFRLRDLILV